LQPACRAGPDGLHAFMGCGDLEGGEAWTFTCPPGHRIVGHSAELVVVETNTDDDEDHRDESQSVETDTDDDEDYSGDWRSVGIARICFVTASFWEPP
jgi:hypothetical protein